MNTPAELKAKAAEMELAAVNFYNQDGQYCLDFEDVDHVEFVFIDGATMMIGPNDLDDCMGVRFSLRPMDNHS